MGHRIRVGWTRDQTAEKFAGPVGNVSVLGMRDRATNQVVAEPARMNEEWGSGMDTMRLRGFVCKHAERGASLYSDQNRCYRGIRHYNHHAVNHSVGEYVRHKAHVNGVESFWALFKRGFRGVCHSMSFKHPRRYIAEFCCRHNIRPLGTLERMRALVRGFSSRRLTWAALTA